ncbi:MAG: hypothetical protein OXU21_06215 [Chloroflexota bacterium]|nr:hypothetical protein [Chloroflexota bacterium]
MSDRRATFWEHVYDLRARDLIPRVWRTGDLRPFLAGPESPQFALTTINVCPFNSSVSTDGTKVGDFVAKGAAPKVWRVGRGQFQLVEDPGDDGATREAEKRRAMNRADQLRLRTKATSGRRGGAFVSTPARSTPPTEPLPESSNRYPSFSIALDPAQRQELASLSTANKAVSIVRAHLRDRYGNRAEIEDDRDGVDLRISIDGRRERVEIKGTESPTLDWHMLKVSSRKSHDALTSGDAAIYRVVDVSGPTPRIYVLTHGQHFTLEPEPRWAVKRVTPADERYSLRGEPYRYELPHEPVASDDWELRP